jgi:gamma-glutamylcysteine synthetase
MKITMVKKILADGSPCKKCGEVLERMEQEDQLRLIDEILVADERDPASDGMLLASELAVDRAPFFVVQRDDGSREVYTVYLKFVKEVLARQTSEAEEMKELLSNNADLDFL